MGAGMIHQMHVMHTRRTGRHAGQARQAPINVLDGFFIRRPIIFQHVLDQVNPAARAIKFVAQHLICGTGRGAEPTMHAGPQNVIGSLDARVAQLFGGEIRLH